MKPIDYTTIIPIVVITVLAHISHSTPIEQNKETKIAALQESFSKTITLIQELSDLNIATHEAQIKLELDKIKLENENRASLAVNGHLIWRITDVANNLGKAKANSSFVITSDPFYTTQYGYKMECQVYFDTPFGLGPHNAVGVYVRPTVGVYDSILEWPMAVTAGFTLYDQSVACKKNIERIASINLGLCPKCVPRPMHGFVNVGRGFGQFVSHLELGTRGYVMNDTMFLGIKVTEVAQPQTNINITIQRNIVPWPNATIPYIINDGSTPNTKFSDEEKELIKHAMCQIEQYSCVRFVLRTVETNYTQIKKSLDKCSSAIGTIGGVQEIKLTQKCFEIRSNWIPIHELLHTIGFIHEHTRADRDEYITIFEESIVGESEFNSYYKYLPPAPNYLGPYDLDSIMHYTGKEYRSGSNRTMLIKSTNTHIRDRINMTAIDIQKLNSWNNCEGFPTNRGSSLNCSLHV